MESNSDRTLIVLFTVITVAAIGAVVYGRVGSFDVERSFCEEGIVFCPEDGVDIAVLDEAAEFWARLGHRVEVGRAGWAICDYRVVYNPTLDDRSSVFDTEYSIERIAPSLKVMELGPGYGPLAAAHGMGHALGYVHGPYPDGALMNARTSRWGWDERGLKATPCQ